MLVKDSNDFQGDLLGLAMLEQSKINEILCKAVLIWDETHVRRSAV